MSERIIIPLDGSKLGEAALTYVRELTSRLAPEEKVEITLFHVITAVRRTVNIQGLAGVLTVPHSEQELETMKNAATDYLNKAGEDLRSEKVTVKCIVAVNENPAEEIIKAEEEINANLVAMSTHGRSGITRFALGSVADKVLQGGTLPVLMVRASED